MKVRQVVLISFYAILLLLSQVVLAPVPNVELVTFLFIISSLNFKLRFNLLLVIIFTILQALMGGWGIGSLVIFGFGDYGLSF